MFFAKLSEYIIACHSWLLLSLKLLMFLTTSFFFQISILLNILVCLWTFFFFSFIFQINTLSVIPMRVRKTLTTQQKLIGWTYYSSGYLTMRTFWKKYCLEKVQLMVCGSGKWGRKKWGFENHVAYLKSHSVTILAKICMLNFLLFMKRLVVTRNENAIMVRCILHLAIGDRVLSLLFLLWGIICNIHWVPTSLNILETSLLHFQGCEKSLNFTKIKKD